MPWVYLVVAGLLEIVWAIAMKQSAGFSRLVPTVVMIVTMLGSVGFLALAMRALPLGTAYMVWTGIGAIGAFIAGIILLGEHVTATRVAAAAMIAAGLITMKLSHG